MRKFSFFIFILISSIYCLHSKQYTVSNNAGIKAQFSDLQHTIDSVAAAGDTIYVSCSPNNYALSSSALRINKPIHLIGEGIIILINIIHYSKKYICMLIALL